MSSNGDIAPVGGLAPAAVTDCVATDANLTHSPITAIIIAIAAKTPTVLRIMTLLPALLACALGRRFVSRPPPVFVIHLALAPTRPAHGSQGQPPGANACASLTKGRGPPEIPIR